MTTVLGIDLSLNHSAFVTLNERGKLARWCFVSATKSHQEKYDNGTWMPYEKKGKDMDREQNNARRLVWWSDYITNLLAELMPTHVGIEDYAFSSDSNSAYQIGEVGGIVRHAVLVAGWAPKLRLHDPTSVKMFGAHAGSAEGETVMMEVRERWEETKVWDPLPNTVKLDLAPAFVIARMVYAEVQLRAGRMQPSDLGHEKEIAVFNRTTQQNPVSLLGRDWITL